MLTLGSAWRTVFQWHSVLRCKGQVPWERRGRTAYRGQRGFQKARDDGQWAERGLFCHCWVLAYTWPGACVCHGCATNLRADKAPPVGWACSSMDSRFSLWPLFATADALTCTLFAPWRSAAHVPLWPRCFRLLLHMSLRLSLWRPFLRLRGRFARERHWPCCTCCGTSSLPVDLCVRRGRPTLRPLLQRRLSILCSWRCPHWLPPQSCSACQRSAALHFIAVQALR